MKREILNGYLVLFCILVGKSDAVDEGNNNIDCFPRFVNVLNLDTRNHRYKKDCRFSFFIKAFMVQCIKLNILCSRAGFKITMDVIYSQTIVYFKYSVKQLRHLRVDMFGQ